MVTGLGLYNREVLGEYMAGATGRLGSTLDEDKVTSNE